MVWIYYEEIELEFEQLMAQLVEAMEPSHYISDGKLSSLYYE